MTGKQMVETIHEHFPQKNGLRVLADLNAEFRRYAEDVRAFHRTISLFEQELVTENGEPIVTLTGEPIMVEQYGSQFPLPSECFIVRSNRTHGSLYIDINGRTITLFQDRAQTTLFPLSADNVADCEVTLDSIIYPSPLQYSDEDRLAAHADAVVAGVLARYYGATGNYAAAKWWKQEAQEGRLKAKQAATTDGSYEIIHKSILTPSRDRR